MPELIMNFRKCTKIKSVVAELNGISEKFSKSQTNQLKLFFDNFVLPEHLVVIASAIRFYKHTGYDINISEISPHNNYLERCDFYKSIGYSFPTKLFRFKNKNLKELTSVDIKLGLKNAMNICNSIVAVIRDNYNVEEDAYKTISFLLWELIDNIFNHAEAKDEFNIIVQNHPQKKELTVCIVDNGIGIYNALAKTEGSKYNYFTPRSAIMNCINRSITNGKGAGNGLYLTKRFIEENKGELILYSGTYCLWLNDKKSIDVHRVPSWEGTIVCLKIKTDNNIDLNAIFEGDIPTTITEHEEMIGGLW